MAGIQQGAMPVMDYFKVRGYVPGGIVRNSREESLDMEVLPPFLRTLLVTDGTVTKSLEAYFWEAVGVETLGQGEVALDAPIDWLGMQAGEQVLRRKVRLKGGESGNVYAFAESFIRLDRLAPGLRQDLLNGKIGIGELLRERGLETYREVLDMGRLIDESLAGVFDAKSCGDLIYRTYRIVVNHEPTILITEYFPYRLYFR